MGRKQAVFSISGRKVYHHVSGCFTYLSLCLSVLCVIICIICTLSVSITLSECFCCDKEGGDACCKRMLLGAVSNKETKRIKASKQRNTDRVTDRNRDGEMHVRRPASPIPVFFFSAVHHQLPL